MDTTEEPDESCIDVTERDKYNRTFLNAPCVDKIVLLLDFVQLFFKYRNCDLRRLLSTVVEIKNIQRVD